MAIILGHMEAEVRSRYLEPEIMALYASYCLGNQSGVDPDQVDALPFSDLVCARIRNLWLLCQIHGHTHLGGNLGQKLCDFQQRGHGED